MRHYDDSTDTLVTLEPTAHGYWDVTVTDTRQVTRRFDTKTDATAFYRYTIARLEDMS